MIDLTVRSKDVTEPNGSPRPLFRDLRFELHGDERSVAITGRSGAGKSTLLRILAGTDVAFDGTYRFDGEDMALDPSTMARHRLTHIGIVTQGYRLLYDIDVAANVMMGASRRRPSRAKADDLLARVHLEGLGRKNPRQLSGGEAQRVVIARALMKDPSVILADEPTGSLDETTEGLVLDLFRELQEGGTRFVVATHSTRVADACDRTVRVHTMKVETVERTP